LLLAASSDSDIAMMAWDDEETMQADEGKEVAASGCGKGRKVRDRNSDGRRDDSGSHQTQTKAGASAGWWGSSVRGEGAS
jgi:hypothetical protein